MKKLFFALLLFSSYFLNAADVTDKRIQWWQMRHQALTEELDALQNSPVFDYAKESINEEIRKCEDVQKQLLELKGGSVASTKEGLTDDQSISKAVNGYAESAFSVIFLKKYLDGAVTPDWSEKSSALMLQCVNESCDRIYGSHDDFFSSRIIAKFTLPSQKKYLPFEFFLNAMVRQKQSLYEDFLARVKNETQSIGSANSGKIYNKDIEEACRRAADGFDIGARLKPEREDFDSAPSANEIISLIESRVSAIKKGSQYLSTSRSTSLDAADYMCDRLAEVDAKYFNAYAEKIIPQPSGGVDLKSSGGIKHSPAGDMSIIVSRIDSQRKKAVLEIKGVENETDTAELLKAHKSEINKFFAENDSTEKRNEAEKYASASSEFYAWACFVKRRNSELIRDLYTAKLAQSKIYLNTLTQSQSSAADGAKVSAEFYKKYSAAMPKTSSFIKSISFAAGLDKSHREKLKPGDIEKCNEATAQFRDFTASIKSDVANIIKESGKNATRLSGEEKQNESSIISFTAKIELSALSENLSAQIARRKKLTYCAETIANYSETFTKLRDIAQSGAIDDDLRVFAEKRSVFALMPLLDMKRFDAERKSADYFARSIVSANARLKQMSDYYKRMDKTSPRIERSAEVKAMLEKPFEADIASWKMNAKNFEETDRKASAMLVQIINRKRYERGNSELASDETGEIAEIGATILIPEGWKENEKDDTSGVLAAFFNEDDFSTLRINAAECSEAGEYEALSNWAKENGIRSIKTGSGNYPDKNYIWMIGETRTKNTFKAFAFFNKEKLIIVSGSSPKDKFPRFSGRIESMFKTLKLK